MSTHPLLHTPESLLSSWRHSSLVCAIVLSGLLIFSHDAHAIEGVTSISVGALHSCALTPTGAVMCWGYNSDGQLGDGTNTQRNSPVSIPSLTSGITSISSGQYHTCAITSAGAVMCWGQNSYGQLGDGTTTQRNSPVSIPSLTSGVTSVSSGEYHSCALTSSGAVMCWGLNSNGQLGDGTNTQRNSPVSIPSLTSGVTSISSGAYHSCALTSAGAAKCWGRNSYGQLGDGTTTMRHPLSPFLL